MNRLHLEILLLHIRLQQDRQLYWGSRWALRKDLWQATGRIEELEPDRCTFQWRARTQRTNNRESWWAWFEMFEKSPSLADQTCCKPLQSKRCRKSIANHLSNKSKDLFFGNNVCKENWINKIINILIHFLKKENKMFWYAFFLKKINKQKSISNWTNLD